MSLRARTFLCAALTAGLALGCADASAARASVRNDVAVDAKDPKPPRVLPGIRPGPSRLQCHESDAKVGSAIDYAGARRGAYVEYRTPAQTVRRYLASRHGDPAGLQRLTYERRTFTWNGITRRNQAVFVGLRKDGTVKAQIALDRANTGVSKYWLVSGVYLCVKGTADR